MNDNELEEHNPAIAPRPWYRNRNAWIILLVTLATPILVFWYMFYRPVEVTRGPWQVLDPGRPVEPVKFEVVEEGSGPWVDPGDLIQVSLWWWSNKENRLEQRDIDRWIWVGFRTEEETLFHSIGPNFVSAFVGLKEGDGIRFLREREPGEYKLGEYETKVPGRLYLNPFGATRSPKWRGGGKREENIHVPHKAYYLTEIGQRNPKTTYVPASPGYTVIHIKKVFKGQLKYRTSHLYDSTWFHYCYNWFSCKYANRPRENWYVDARYDGISADGQVATFLYGPVDTSKEPWNRPAGMYQIVEWSEKEWERLPVGVQIK
ncbi:MAG: hypothetical protein LBI59_01575 [Candidatus Accumulibacter sp.]|nr:hypothetical protein [Accumulibacter sp.]